MHLAASAHLRSFSKNGEAFVALGFYAVRQKVQTLPVDGRAQEIVGGDEEVGDLPPPQMSHKVLQELLKAVGQVVHPPVGVLPAQAAGVEQCGLAQVGEELGQLPWVLLLQLVQEVLQQLQTRLSVKGHRRMLGSVTLNTLVSQ